MRRLDPLRLAAMLSLLMLTACGSSVSSAGMQFREYSDAKKKFYADYNRIDKIRDDLAACPLGTYYTYFNHPVRGKDDPVNPPPQPCVQKVETEVKALGFSGPASSSGSTQEISAKVQEAQRLDKMFANQDPRAPIDGKAKNTLIADAAEIGAYRQKSFRILLNSKRSWTVPPQFCSFTLIDCEDIIEETAIYYCDPSEIECAPVNKMVQTTRNIYPLSTDRRWWYVYERRESEVRQDF